MSATPRLLKGPQVAGLPVYAATCSLAVGDLVIDPSPTEVFDFATFHAVDESATETRYGVVGANPLTATRAIIS